MADAPKPPRKPIERRPRSEPTIVPARPEPKRPLASSPVSEKPSASPKRVLPQKPVDAAAEADEPGSPRPAAPAVSPKSARAATPAATRKPAVVSKAAEDEFGKEAAPRSLPPVVVKKKKKADDGGPIVNQQAIAKDVTPASEVLVPSITIAIGLLMAAITTIAFRPEHAPIGTWLAVRMVMIGASLLITYGALFICSAVVEADYGYISTGAIKVAAIVLTQQWVGDIAEQLWHQFQIPFVGGLIAWLTTYGMFKYFFGLDDMEAIASMFVVRLVHWVVVVFLFVALVSAIFSGSGLELLGVWGLGEGNAAIEADGDGDAGDGWEMKEIELDAPAADAGRVE